MRGSRLRYLVGADNIVWEQMACLALYPNHKIWKLFFLLKQFFYSRTIFFVLLEQLKNYFETIFLFWNKFD